MKNRRSPGKKKNKEAPQKNTDDTEASNTPNITTTVASNDVDEVDMYHEPVSPLDVPPICTN